MQLGGDIVNVNQKIENALADLVNGNIWPLSKPEETDPDNWIVYNPEVDIPGDFGEDVPLEWIYHIQIHWFKKGVANYLRVRKKIRKILIEEGFSVNDITCLKEKSNGEVTHLIFSVNILEEDPYGET